MKKTKIVCTIGPASADKKTMKRMLSAGMNAVRINTAHGDFEEYASTIKTARELADLPIIIDIKGPDLRIKTPESIPLQIGKRITVGFSNKFPVYLTANCYKDFSTGDRILIQDGTISARVVDKKNQSIVVEFTEGSLLKTNSNVGVMGKELTLPALSEKDKKALEFAKQKNADYIALSYTRNLKDIERVRRILGRSGIGIIAKIENQEGLDNFDDIVDNADGIMVARGDLGVSLPLQKVPLIQKDLIKRCNLRGKLVITATQMLESMITNKRPTRAEASDVANAILDGTDAVMLSGETAIGKYPIDAVRVMSDIAHVVEPSFKWTMQDHRATTTSEAITHSVATLVSNMDINEIVCLTHSGFTAQMLSRNRLSKPILAVTSSHRVKRHLKLYYGIHPVQLEIPKHHKITIIGTELFKRGLLEKDDVVVFTAGVHTQQTYKTNLIEVHHLADLLEYSKKQRLK